MTFDLRLQFLGLAAYVPESETRMHVLLPVMKHQVSLPARPDGGDPTEHGGVHAHQDIPFFRDGDDMFTGRGAAAKDNELSDKHRHYPGLMYDAAYLKPNQSELLRHYQYLDFERRLLNLSALSDSTSEGFEPRLPHELPDLQEVSERVSWNHVQGLPKGSLGGRVTIASGALTRYALGATFHLNDAVKSTRMAWETEWTIRGIRGVPDENGIPHLSGLILEGPNEGEYLPLPRLYPIAQTIQLTIFNAMSTVFPPKGALYHIPKPSGSTHHFLAYHGLSEALHTPPRKPVPAQEKPVTVDGPVPKPVGDHMPGVICVQVQTRLKDM